MIWRWEVLASILKDDNPQLGAEIGVKEGRFIAYMLKNFPNLEMYAIDPWEAQPDGNESYKDWDFKSIYATFKENIRSVSDRVIELRAYSLEAAKVIEDASLDFVFIDAQHDYLSVKLDIETWSPKVKPGGLISGHDYDERFPGVVQAVNEKYIPTIGNNSVWYVRA